MVHVVSTSGHAVVSVSFWHAHHNADLNIRASVLQLVPDSNDEDPQVDCTVSVLDAEGGISSTQVLQFAVHANSPGEVCTLICMDHGQFTFLCLSLHLYR